MKYYNISYKDQDYPLTGFLKGFATNARTMIEAIEIFQKTHPNGEIIGILQHDD